VTVPARVSTSASGAPTVEAAASSARTWPSRRSSRVSSSNTPASAVSSLGWGLSTSSFITGQASRMRLRSVSSRRALRAVRSKARPWSSRPTKWGEIMRISVGASRGAERAARIASAAT
jgi:hypothetical protein